jgi:hypothetical protein
VRIKVTIHLASGATLHQMVPAPDVEDAEDWLDDFRAEVSGPPHWKRIGDAVLYTQTISAIEAEELIAQKGS